MKTLRYVGFLVMLGLVFLANPVCSLAANSPDGTTLFPGGSGSVVTSAGTWTFSTSTNSSGNIVLLNGSQIAAGSGVEMMVANGGQLYVLNASNKWFVWSGSSWSVTSSPTTVTNGVCGSSNNGSFSSAPTTGLCSVGPASTVSGTGPWTWSCAGSSGGTNASCSASKSTATISPDGSVLLPGSGTNLVTSAGTWTFSTTTNSSGNIVLLNGTQVALGAGVEMMVANGGQLYVLNAMNKWFVWTGSTWSASSSPTSSVNGVCGSANGTTVTSAPATNLCSAGTASTVSGTGPWTWSCVGSGGGSNASCSASKSTGTISPDGSTLTPGGSGGLVTSAGTWTFSSSTNSSGNLILLNGKQVGSGAGVEIVVANGGQLYALNATGQWFVWNGSSYSKTTSPLPTVNGTCGAANGVAVSTAPASGLCTAGTASTVAGSGPWTWSCTGSGGGTNATCSAPLQSVNGTCGPANGVAVSTAPTSGLCTAGTASTVTGTGPWTWSCAGSGSGTTASCTAPTQSANGQCGSSNGTYTNVAPNSGLCATGTASTVTGSGPWTWSCSASGGGTNASCQAFLGNDPTMGVLPPYDDVYTNWNNAGLNSIGGIPTRTTVCATVNPLGGGADDFTNIQNAINNCPAGQVVQLGAGAFNIKIADMPIQVNKGITLRGTGTCNGNVSSYPSALCQTSINVANGLLAYTSDSCGAAGSTSGTACPNGGPAVIELSPVAPDYNYSWAKCGNVGAALGTGCGATTLTADAVQGQSTIQVSSTTGFAVGQWVLIDEASGAGWVADPLNSVTKFGSVWAAPDWLNPSGSPATGRVLWSKGQNGNWDFGSTSYPYQANSTGCWHSYCDRPTAELHKISAIGTGTITFDDPLTIAFRQSGGHSAQVYIPYANQSGSGSPMSFVQQAGVENLSILRGPNGGVEMEFCAYCWLNNVEIGDWYGGGVSIEYSARSELNNVYIHHCWDSVNSGGEYPIDLGDASTEILITNSITNFAGKGMVARAGGAGSVVSYSYMDDTMYDDRSGIGDYWVDMDINASHYSGPHHVLFEGNWGDNLDNDNTHGNSMYMTFFRNQGTGLRTPFTDPSLGKPVNDFTGVGYTNGTSAAAPAPLRAAGPMAYNYWFSFVGNVLGLAGETTAAHGWTYQGDWSGKRMFMPGWNAGLGGGQGGQDPYMNGTSGTYIYRHGNFDYVNNSVLWDAGTSDHTLPNSFYLLSAPSSFSQGASCTYAWPWVTPTGTTPIQTNSCGGSGLPAKARWDAGTPFIQP